VKNEDNQCFKWAVLSALHPAEIHSDRLSKYHQYKDELNFQGLTFPMTLNQISKFEELNEISINIITFNDDEGRARRPLYVSKFDFQQFVDLLYWEEHFAWIKDLGRFLYDINKHKERKLICRRCFGHFKYDKAFENHKRLCTADLNGEPILKMPSAGSRLKFKNYRNMERVPFVIYCDFESVLKQMTPSEKQKTEKFQQHEPCSVGIKVVSIVEEHQFPYQHYFGSNCVDWFLDTIENLEEQIHSILANKKPLQLTEDQQFTFSVWNRCYICDELFTEQDPKVSTTFFFCQLQIVISVAFVIVIGA